MTAQLSRLGLTTARAILVAICFMVMAQGPAFAGMLAGPIWDEDTPTSAVVRFTHGPIDMDAVHFPGMTFVSPSGFWDIRGINVVETEKDPAVPFRDTDTVSFGGTLRHRLGPHPGDNSPGGEFSFQLFNIAPFMPTESSSSGPVAHPSIGHIDVFSATLTSTIDPNNSRDISSYVLVARGMHTVPEPSALLAFGTGALALLGYGWGCRKRTVA